MQKNAVNVEKCREMKTRINTRAPDGANKKVESLLESWQSQVTTMNMSLKPFINFSAAGI